MLEREKILSLVMMLLTPSIALAKVTQCPANPTGLRYHPLKGSQIALSVSINHSGPYEFMVDTGAQITVIDPQLAADLKLGSQGTIGLVAVLNKGRADLVKAELVEAGAVAVHDLTMAVAGLKQIQAVNPRVRGILGENFLGRFDLLIDYGHKVICLDPSKELQKHLQGEQVPTIGQANRDDDLAHTSPVLVTVRMHGDGKKRAVLRLDSGTNYPLLYESPYSKMWWTESHQVRRGSVTGNGGAVSLAVMQSQYVEIGPHTSLQIAFRTPINAEHAAFPAGEDGLLPTILFKRIFISHSDHFVIFEPLERF